MTFASAGAFMTVIGYRTNRTASGPGAYRFSSVVRVRSGLQLLLASR